MDFLISNEFAPISSPTNEKEALSRLTKLERNIEEVRLVVDAHKFERSAEVVDMPNFVRQRDAG